MASWTNAQSVHVGASQNSPETQSHYDIQHIKNGQYLFKKNHIILLLFLRMEDFHVGVTLFFVERRRRSVQTDDTSRGADARPFERPSDEPACTSRE